jgi:hypothetical protein
MRDPSTTHGRVITSFYVARRQCVKTPQLHSSSVLHNNRNVTQQSINREISLQYSHVNVISTIVLDCVINLLHKIPVSCRIVYIAVLLFYSLFLHLYDGFVYIDTYLIFSIRCRVVDLLIPS